MSLRHYGQARVILGIAALMGVVVLAIAFVGLDLQPGIVLAILAAGIAIPFLVLRPDVGVHLFLVTIYVENLVYSDEGVTGIKLAGGLILAGWLLSVAVNRRVNLPMTPLIGLMLVFLAWLWMTVIYAFDADLAVGRVLTFVQLGIVMFMFGSVVDSTEKVRGVYRAIVLWTTLAVAHGLALYFLGLRDTSAGVVLNRNLMATYIDIAIVCAYILYQMSPGGGERLALVLALPTMFLGLALTFSRTGYVTLVLVFVLVSYRLAKTRGYLVLAGTAAMLLLMAAFLPEAFYKRAESIIPSMRYQEDTFGMRVEVWKAGAKMIRDHPVVGVGPGNFLNALGRYGQGILLNRRRIVSHNTYVGIAAEAGLPALILFLALCGAAIRGASIAARGLKRGFPVIGLQAVAVELCIVIVLIAGLTGDSERLKYLYIFFGLALSLGRLTRQAMAGEGAAAGWASAGVPAGSEALPPR